MYKLDCQYKLFLTVAFIFLSKISFSQCATCQAVAETSLENGETTIASGINIGVLYMLSILFLIGGIGIYVVWKHRNADGSISK